jgi:hypothetical protein
MSGSERLTAEQRDEEARKELEAIFFRNGRSWPDITAEVMHGSEWRGKYDVEVAVKDRDILPEIEERERSVYCRACITEDAGGYSHAIRMYVGLEDDLLRNFPKLLRLSCRRCGFETRLPVKDDVYEDAERARIDARAWQRIARRIEDIASRYGKDTDVAAHILRALDEFDFSPMRADEIMRRYLLPSLKDLMERQGNALNPVTLKPAKKKKK